MAQGSGQQQQPQDNTLTLLFMVAFVVLGVYFFFRSDFGHVQTIKLANNLLYWQVYVFGLMLEPFAYEFDELVPLFKYVVTLLDQLQAMPYDADYISFLSLQSEANFIWKVPSILLALFSVIYLNLFYAGSGFNTIFSMKTLRDQWKYFWPYSLTVAKEEKSLVDVPLTEGPFAMSQNPVEFGLKNGVLKEITKDGAPALEVIEEMARRTFSLQMGQLWHRDLKNLPEHYQALFAAFAAFAAGDEQRGRAFLKQMAFSSEKGVIDFKGTWGILRKHLQSKVVGRAVGAHAYGLTAMASMLEAARTSGVVATSEFLWLKTVDRRLWYMLNSVGRQTPFVEVAGPFAHWLVEKRLRRPLSVPMVDQAVVGFKIALEEVKYNPDDSQ